ncbi:cation transporter [Candidatus Mycoplasma mahonii]|uniref:cation transporter n=1 Tax=Candidatus Mycoplasma mahonii TaxID=3004105 RepID=UPI0026ECFABA|nr:heavy metal-associated domain-containing protein [Candidatus Mycoplasma mahonii]WKX02166.1 heavy metal-associated domain-containing protein [Candidatus Mycoplasma mahonii]
MTISKLKVNMHCAACAINIDKTLNKIGCESISNPVLKITKIKYDENKITHGDIIKAIKGIGYEARKS